MTARRFARWWCACRLRCIGLLLSACLPTLQPAAAADCSTAATAVDIGRLRQIGSTAPVVTTTITVICRAERIDFIAAPSGDLLLPLHLEFSDSNGQFTPSANNRRLRSDRTGGQLGYDVVTGPGCDLQQIPWGSRETGSYCRSAMRFSASELDPVSGFTPRQTARFVAFFRARDGSDQTLPARDYRDRLQLRLRFGEP